jgi:MarR family transcriptional regulator, organic hydroperoxide resistance regulator
MTTEQTPKPTKAVFRTREQEAAVGLLRTTDAIRRHFSAIVAPHGITLQQYNVLRILRGAGRDGLPTLAIGERMVEQTPGVTRLIDRLVKKGFVTRRPCDEDRRRVYCHLTPLGLKVVNSLDEPIARGDATSVAPLTPGDLDRLIGLLDRIRAHNE